MSGVDLFGVCGSGAQQRGEASGGGAPRLLEPQRDQIELRAMDIDSLIGDDHPARAIWAYVAPLDLHEVERRIKARGAQPGRPAISPRLMLALWLYATSQGVGSARALERLCRNHDVYRWLCGGVSVNYHTLAEFRVGAGEMLDRLLAEHLMALTRAGLVDLDVLAQDGVRIRANAATGSFRRGATLAQQLETAQAVVAHLKAELDTDAPASERRIEAARRRAASQRAARVQAAQKALAELEAQRAALKKKGGNGKPQSDPRASTTDAEARVMKMADAGFRPAYNVQVASVAGTPFVVATQVSNNGSDGHRMRPMLEKVRQQTGRLPARHLVDGGYGGSEEIAWAHSQNVAVYCPAKQTGSAPDPYLPRDSDGPAIAAWRARMGCQDGKAQYRLRTICECIHARWRNWGLRQFTVRGMAKVGAIVSLFALTNNVLQGQRLANA